MRRFIAVLSLSLIGLAPLSAQACQLICFLTANKYSGSQVGGVAGGDAKCAAEYAGFKFVRNGSLASGMANTSIPADLAQSVGAAWVADNFAARANNYSCSNFTSDSGNGPAIGAVNSSGYYIYQRFVSCGGSYPLLCCNM